jgi:predicted DNA-binding protein (UPF0251 family)
MDKAIKIRKSLEMTKEQKSAFKKWFNAQPTKQDAAKSLEISRPALDRLILAGRSRQDVIERVISKISA